MDYAVDSCRLQRSFGTDKSKVYLRIERFAPTAHFSLTLFGKPLRVTNVTMPLRLMFGPNGVEDKREGALGGSAGETDKLPMLIVEARDCSADPIALRFGINKLRPKPSTR